MKILRSFLPWLLLLTITADTWASALINETDYTFTNNDGESVAAFRGAIAVPENRNNPDSRMIPLTYVRFPSTSKTPGSPIIYLSGGPGGSGIATARWRRFPLFMAMREFGDVIALDQRGTGASDILPRCQSNKIVPAQKAIDDDEYIALHQQALRDCIGFWQSQNVDLTGYNTLESVSDLDDLRRHLGTHKITLWGISYGSHLALAALKQMDDRIDRVIIASAEGLDQTIKMPVRTDAYFDRLQAAINTQPKMLAQFPDIKALIRRVHTQLEKSPLKLDLTETDGPATHYLLQRRDMQEIASAMISDPERAIQLLQLYSTLDNGISQPVSELVKRWYQPGKPIEYTAMSIAMDIASGIGKQRAATVYTQAKTALLNTYLNFTLHFVDIAPELDLGDTFREPPDSQVPTLLFSGTLDGRTYIESQRESVQGLTNLTHVTVTNAGHNLFMSSPQVQKIMADFLGGNPLSKMQIAVALPDFVSP